MADQPKTTDAPTVAVESGDLRSQLADIEIEVNEFEAKAKDNPEPDPEAPEREREREAEDDPAEVKDDPEREAEVEAEDDPEEDAPRKGESKAETKSRRDKRIQQLVEQKNKHKSESDELKAEVARLKALVEPPEGDEPEPVDYTQDPIYKKLIDKGYEEEQALDMTEMMVMQRESLREEFAPARDAVIATEQQQRIDTLAVEMKADGHELNEAWDDAISATIKGSKAIQEVMAKHPMEALRMAYKMTNPPKGAKARAVVESDSGDDYQAPTPPGRKPAGADDDLGAGLDFSGDIRSQLSACEAVVNRRQGKV